jgi:hypothetical protein
MGFSASLWIALAASGELPPQAVVFKTVTAKFSGYSSPLNVIFYCKDMAFAGVLIESGDGKPVAQERMDVPHCLLEETGVYDMTGDANAEIVLSALVGAKTTETRIYSLQDRRLVKIAEWSGWSFKVLHVRGAPVAAFKPLEYGALTEFYVWKGGGFIGANESFPELYTSEIKEQENFLDSGRPFPAYVFSQSCKLAAQAYVYGKAYDAATTTCRKALQIITSGEAVVPNGDGEPAEQAEQEKTQAVQEIRNTLGRIEQAREKGLSRLAK